MRNVLLTIWTEENLDHPNRPFEVLLVHWGLIIGLVELLEPESKLYKATHASYIRILITRVRLETTDGTTWGFGLNGTSENLL